MMGPLELVRYILVGLDYMIQLIGPINFQFRGS